MRKIYLGIVTVFILMFVIACTDKNGNDGFESLNPNTSGTLDILVWSGDGIYYEDLGKQNIVTEDLINQNNAAIYAMAKEFNKTYPNVKINLLAVTTGDADWDQQRELFRDEHGKYPDIFAVADLPGDVSKGLVADLSYFEEDPLYQSFNPSIMSMMNYYGVQAGLPQFLVPSGVFVNRELAEMNNIDAPTPNWTIEEYTDFISQADKTSFWGAQDVPTGFFFTGSTTLVKQIYEHTGNGPRINLNSTEVRQLLTYVNKWAHESISPLRDMGQYPEEEPTGYDLFALGNLLTYADTPWLLGDAAHPSEEHWGHIHSSDWDYYPRPSTDYVGNTIGIINDPIAIYNYELSDNVPGYSEEEAAKLELAYAFASYWVGSTEALQARADQTWLDGTTVKTALNDSLPLVTGELFDEQMDVWFSVDIHERYKDASLMPGFHKILEIWEAGEMFDVTSKTYPSYYSDAGTRKEVLYEWNNLWDPTVITGNPEATSPWRTDSNWYSTVISKLNEWNIEINQRYAFAFDELKGGLRNYYGKTDDELR